MSLCRFRDALGVPGEGLHFHVMGVAVVDVAATLAAAWLATRWLGGPFWAWAVGAFALGAIAHRVFCVRTTLDRALFGS